MRTVADVASSAFAACRYHPPMSIDLVRQTLQGHPEVQLAIVFGSVARGQARPDSDIDVAVQAKAPLDVAQKLALIGDLAAATGRAVDLVDLRTAGEPVLGQILSHGQRVVGSPSDFAALLSRHLVDQSDFMPYVNRMLAERRRAWIGS